MGILDRLVAWFDPTADWVADYRLQLEFNFDTSSLCGVRIGSPIADLKKLGQAENWRAAREGLLCYYSHGLEIETNAGIITSYELVFNSAPGISARHQRFRGVCKFRGESVILNEDTREEKVVQVFGPPHEREEDEDEVLLVYERDDIGWEVEFSPQDRLRCVIIVSSPLTADAEK
jgi:hypothetical protein